MTQRQDTLWLMWSAVASPRVLWPVSTAGMCAPRRQQRSCGTGCLDVRGMLLASEDCKIGGQLHVPDGQGVRLGSSAWLSFKWEFILDIFLLFLVHFLCKEQVGIVCLNLN